MAKDSKIMIGIAGWSYPDWQSIVYPRGIKDKLGYVSRFVDCIEINSTFYRPPEVKNTLSWLDHTKNHKDFFFTGKLHKSFTHEGLIDTDMVRIFIEGYRPMLEAGRFRQLLAQFRYDFDCTSDNRKYLSALIRQFGRDFPIVVEVRHRSWQDADGLKFLEGLGVTVANIDYPVGKDSFNPELCTVGQSGYFRLHGRNTEKWFSKSSRDETYDYFYSKDELFEIKDRITKLARILPSVVVITNNHYRGAELANALELKSMITGQKVNVPEDLMLRYPRLKEIAKNRPLF